MSSILIRRNRDFYIKAKASFVGLLDLYPNAAAAWSLRKLRAAYTGACIRVRRSSDNAETDIGFDNNVLDTGALLSFVGAGNGFVTTWYDQSGFALNLSQTTAGNQPQIVSSGAVLLVNGKPNIMADNRFMSTSTGLTDSQGFIFSVSQNNSGQFIIAQSASTSNNNWLMLDDLGAGGTNRSARVVSQLPTNVIRGNTNVNNIQKLLVHSSNGTVYSFWANSIAQTLTVDSGTNNGLWFNARNFPLFLGRLNRPLFVNGNSNVQEVVIYPTNQSSNRTGIETNINNYYAIY